MCGRYNFDPGDSSEIGEIIGSLTGFKTGEVFPTNPVLVVSPSGPAVMQWGYPGFNGGRTIINARSETAHERPMFRRSLEERRCIIPTTGFFEWDHAKKKFLFNLPDIRPLYLAGLWNVFNNEQKCVILTTAANRSMESIHNRMPVVLTKDLLGDWLSNTQSAYGILHEIPPELEHIAV